jgi:hypothetical protein
MSKPKERKPNTDEIKKQVKARAAKEKENVIPANKSSQINQSRYSVEDGYWCRIKYSKEGKELPIPLCNFTARITEENIIDDGQDTNHLFTVEGRLFDKIPLQKLDIPAEKFPGLSWVLKWGSRCCLEPSYTVREFIRYAIQRASPNAPVKTHYGHTGWREINGEWVYLHAGGAIGTGPDMPQVSVRLSREIERYSLPLTPFYRQEGAADFLAAEKNGLEASLRLLDIGSRAVTIPLFCLVYLAPLTTLLNPMPNFSFYLFGQSGTFKTTVALLALAHFGNFGGADCLSNFEDTPGILEKRSFILKDTLHVIDDFHPSSNRRAAESKEGIAQRMIRAYSNRTARGRLNSDMSERGRYEPRGMMLMTAEEQPTLESTLARVCIIEVTDGSIERGPLSEVQAAAGKLPYAMAAYIRWVRENMDAIKETFPGRFRELRAKAAADGFHKKLPEQAAYMGFALETAVSFFCEKGAMTQDSAFALVAEGWDIFRQLAKQQQQRIEEDDPVALFFEIISTLLLQGQARLEPLPGHSGERIGAGEQIGWYDASSLFLLPTAIWSMVQRRCISEGTHFPFTKTTFFKMLKNRGIIIPAPSGQSSLLVKIGSKPVRVLKVIDRGVYEKSVTSVTN